MKLLFDFLRSIAGWKTFLLLLVLYLFLSGFLLKNAEMKVNHLAGKNIGVIDLTIGFDIDRTLVMVKEYGAEARRQYLLTTATLDVAYPIVYACLFSITLILLYREKLQSWMLSIVWLNMLLDLLENITIILMLSSFPDQSRSIAAACEVFKLLKWVSLALIGVLVIIGLFSMVIKLLKLKTP